MDAFLELADFYNSYDELDVTPYDYAQYQKLVKRRCLPPMSCLTSSTSSTLAVGRCPFLSRSTMLTILSRS